MTARSSVQAEDLQPEAAARCLDLDHIAHGASQQRPADGPAGGHRVRQTPLEAGEAPIEQLELLLGVKVLADRMSSSEPLLCSDPGPKSPAP
jgi:hypothetical protein